MKTGFALLTASAFLMSCLTACEDEKTQEEACKAVELPGQSSGLCDAIDDCYDRGWDTDELLECRSALWDYQLTWAYCGVSGWDYDCNRVQKCVETCGDFDTWKP
jgi:hypothetical protein